MNEDIIKENEKLVVGQFNNIRFPGGKVKIFYKPKLDEKGQKYTLKDGYAYVIPMGVAKMINRPYYEEPNKPIERWNFIIEHKKEKYTIPGLEDLLICEKELARRRNKIIEKLEKQ